MCCPLFLPARSISKLCPCLSTWAPVTLFKHQPCRAPLCRCSMNSGASAHLDDAWVTSPW